MIELLILLALATAIVLIWRTPETAPVAIVARIGGIGWILWVALQVVRLLVRGG